MSDEKRIYSISRAAGLAQCPAQWMRDHDHLLKPLKDEAGRRAYTEHHIQLARALRQRIPSSADAA